MCERASYMLQQVGTSRNLRVNLLGPGPHLIKKNLPGRGLTKVEKHCSIVRATLNGQHKMIKNVTSLMAV